jgi:hypothetical protein
MMKGKCSRCKNRLTLENASPSVVTSGNGRCRLCENEHTKKRSRTLGGKFNQGSAQAKHNGHKWDLSFQQYAAIVAFDECFYCGGPLPKAAAGLDRESNGDYAWDIVLPCCGKQPRAAGPRGCNEIKSGEIPPIVLFARRWYEKYAKLPTEQDFFDKLQNFRTERDRAYQILCALSSEELKKLRRDTSVRKFLASLGRILGRGNGS